MTALPRIVEVTPSPDRVLRVAFDDGLVRELDLRPLLTGMLAVLDDDVAFAAVRLDPVSGTICWPGGMDLDPDVLHGDHEPASGPNVLVLAEYRRLPTR